MTLTLQHEEVQQYFDMKEDIAFYKNKVLELETELALLYQEQNDKSDSVQSPIEYEGFNRSGTHWTQEEKNVLTSIRNKNGIYDGMHIDSILQFFPGRTRSAVISALWTKNIGVRNGRLKFKLLKA